MMSKSQISSHNTALTRAINIVSDDRNVVKYKLTLQRIEQLWLHKLDWWWSHHTRMIGNVQVAQPPVIEKRIVTERKLVD